MISSARNTATGPHGSLRNVGRAARRATPAPRAISVSSRFSRELFRPACAASGRHGRAGREDHLRRRGHDARSGRIFAIRSRCWCEEDVRATKRCRRRSRPCREQVSGGRADKIIASTPGVTGCSLSPCRRTVRWNLSRKNGLQPVSAPRSWSSCRAHRQRGQTDAASCSATGHGSGRECRAIVREAAKLMQGGGGETEFLLATAGGKNRWAAGRHRQGRGADRGHS